MLSVIPLRATTSVRSNFLSILQEKNLLFLFYTSTFTKHPHQFIYSTHLFNKMFILLHFLLFSHSWPLSLSHCLSLSLRPNHRHHHLATIKPKPRSPRPKLYDFFVSHSHGWLEPKPRPIQAKVDADEEDQQRVNEKRKGWSDPLKQVEKKRPMKRLIRPIEA